ncbi:MAG TPA: hypothetical protein VNH18_02065, partial [Bryobacteraceae bacterium]|nr:hypothetical protein [Bryobacteraceae bacterium]
VNFHFAGVDGRGRQNLTRDPRNGGVAVVRIEDSDGGSEGYTFDVTWGAAGGQNNGGDRGPNVPFTRDNRGDDRAPGYNRPPGSVAPGYGAPGNDRGPGYDRDAGEGQYRPDYRDSDYYRRYNHGFGPEEVVRVCQVEIQRQAANRFRRAEIHFDRTRIDDNPGRQDWVVGLVDVHRGPRGERFRFSCSVDFNTGRVRTATLDPEPVGGGYR